MANENRLIDACALNREIDCCEFESISDYSTICEQIIQAPTVDAVEVVRCKDCKHWHRGTISCDMNDYLGVRERPCWYEEDFCSYGERRTDERTD